MATAANAHGGAIHAACEGRRAALVRQGWRSSDVVRRAEPVRSHALLAAVAQALPLLTPRRRPAAAAARARLGRPDGRLVGTAGSGSRRRHDGARQEPAARHRPRAAAKARAMAPSPVAAAAARSRRPMKSWARCALATAAWLDVAATGGDDAALRL